MEGEMKRSFDAWRALLHVGWLAVLLGLVMEVILVVLAAGFGTLKGANPILADLVQKVSWSVVVCVGLAFGTTAKKARGPRWGLRACSPRRWRSWRRARSTRARCRRSRSRVPLGRVPLWH